MKWLYQQWDPSLEREILAGVSQEIPWGLVERFSTLVRESGTEPEWKAARYIADQLRSWGVRVQIYEPELLISLPRKASLEIVSPEAGRQIRAKTPAFSRSTNGRPVVADVVYVPGARVEKIEEMFDSQVTAVRDLRGKVVLTEGLSMPMKVRDYELQGAAAQVYINPGTEIHEGICTSIWGTPTLAAASRKPATPILCVNRPDGERLAQLAQSGGLRLKLETHLDEGWVQCPVTVASIQGSEEPEKFLLVHGHLDSWHEGIGDNATGDAALFELARVFTKHRKKLKRSLRVAWWPGHSHGRYAGSTWYADHFALDLERHCIAQVDIDSPGCRWATEYREDVMWMKEAEDFCRHVIRDVTGQDSRGKRPLRAGDYSFNQIGLTGFFMLLSNIPPEVRKEKGFRYIVGGCGGNTAWHTEKDTLEVADAGILYTDIQIYATAISRVLNSKIYPFNHIRVADELLACLKDYQEQSKGHFDLGPSLKAAVALKNTLVKFYKKIENQRGRKDARRINQCLMDLARILVPVNYAKGERFDQDPAISLPPLPRLEPVKQLPGLAQDQNPYRFLQTELQREQNKVVAALESAARLAGQWVR